MLPHPRLSVSHMLGRVTAIVVALVGIAACTKAPASGTPSTSPGVGSQVPTYASAGNQALTYAPFGNQALTNMTHDPQQSQHYCPLGQALDCFP
jgi:hypothetical protein